MTKFEIGAIARKMGSDIYYPSDGPPYKPFQQWVKKAENLQESPIGLMVHPEFGLWHAYRAALVVPSLEDIPTVSTQQNICDTCTDKPCLSACPVHAFSEQDGYDVPTCTRYLKSNEGQSCMGFGCAARRACPIGRDYTYKPDHAHFHMKAFRKNH